MSRQLFLLTLLTAAAVALPAQAAIFTVTKTADTFDGRCDQDCSLREAVAAANAASGPDVIVLPSGVYTLTRTGANEDGAALGDLDIAGDLVLLGAGAKSTIIDGNHADRVLDVLAPFSAEIQGVTLRNGHTAAPGGAVANGGTLKLDRCEIRDSSADQGGGGLYSVGSVTLTASTIAGNSTPTNGGGALLNGEAKLTNVTVSGNVAGSSGGGLYYLGSADSALNNTTITANRATTRAGGILVESTPFIGNDIVIVTNSILAANTAGHDVDCLGAVASGGHNVVGITNDCVDFDPSKGDKVGQLSAIDPRLSPLGDFGGPTSTHALLDASPALDNGDAGTPGSNSSACAATDQRGTPRPGTARCDSGAFERTSACVAGGATLCLADGRFQVTATFRTATGTATPAQGVTLTGDTGYFWFFDPANVEVTAKVLNACGPQFHRYWVFLSGLTNVEVVVRVEDTLTHQVKTYTNPLNTTFRTNLDTNAFDTCS